MDENLKNIKQLIEKSEYGKSLFKKYETIISNRSKMWLTEPQITLDTL